MADKTVITPQQRFKVLTKLFEAGFKSEKDLQSINFQNVFRIEGLTVQGYEYHIRITTIHKEQQALFLSWRYV